MHNTGLTSSATPPWRFSDNSTESVPDSLWFASDFLLGAGTVIIQPATVKVVLVYRDDLKIWFLPKGRKDAGESLEETALREAYEESGYRTELLPLSIPTRAPSAPVPAPRDASATSSDDSTQAAVHPRFNTEPIYASTRSYQRTSPHNGGEYIIFWYVGFIGPDAVREENTGMADEQHFVAHLMPPEEAISKLGEPGDFMADRAAEARVVRMAYDLWVDTQEAHRT